MKRSDLKKAKDRLWSVFSEFIRRRDVRVLSTTELSDIAYRDYWGKCVQWAVLPTKDEGLGVDSGLGLYIRLPNEVDFENY